MALVAESLRPSHVSAATPRRIFPAQQLHDDKLDHTLLYAAIRKTPPTLHKQDDGCHKQDLREAIGEEFKIYEVLALDCEDVVPLEFWKRNSARLLLLAEIVCIVLTPPATSVPSERVFSSAGWIRETRRSRLTPEHTEMLVKLGHYIRLHGPPSSLM